MVRETGLIAHLVLAERAHTWVLRYTPVMQGLHLVADLSACHAAPAYLLDEQVLLQACLQAVQRSGLQAVGQLAVRFPAAQGHASGGVTATVLLAESHLCVHTWPENNAVTLDVYVCNRSADHSAKAQHLMAAMVALFAPEHVQQQSWQRGGHLAG